MKKNILGIFCFTVIFLKCSFVRAGALETFLLEPIVISKEKVSLLKTYRLSKEVLVANDFNASLGSVSLYPVDTQARVRHADIQSDFSIRGSTFQGVLMLLDGSRINDPQTAHHNADIPLTKEDIASIEVLPGAASSLYGPDAIGGAIQIHTKKPQNDEWVVELSGGSFNSTRELISVTEKTDHLGVRVSVENQQSGGFSEGTDFKKFTSAFSSLWPSPAGDIGLDFGYQEKEFGAFDFYTPGLKYPSREWTKTHLLNASWLVEKEWVCKPSFLWRRHYDTFKLDDTEVRSKYLNHHRTDMLVPGVYFRRDTGYWGEVGIGLEYGNERIRSTNLGKHSRGHAAVLFDDSKALSEALSAGASARVDSYDKFDTVYTGSFSLRYSFCDEQSLHAAVNRSMRVPSFTELYYNDPTTIGDESLGPEKALQYQIGYAHERENTRWGADIFLRREEDVIDWVKYSSSQAKWKVENITRADASGVETFFGSDIAETLTFYANYNYTHKRIDDQGLLYKYGPNYASHKAGIALSGNFRFLKPHVSLAYKKRPGRGGWITCDSSMRVPVNKHAEFFFSASNIFDKNYQDIAGIASAGCAFEAGLRVEW